VERSRELPCSDAWPSLAKRTPNRNCCGICARASLGEHGRERRRGRSGGYPKNVIELEELSLRVLLPNDSHLGVGEVRLRLFTETLVSPSSSVEPHDGDDDDDGDMQRTTLRRALRRSFDAATFLRSLSREAGMSYSLSSCTPPANAVLVDNRRLLSTMRGREAAVLRLWFE
jgi:hypothetical protein